MHTAGSVRRRTQYRTWYRTWHRTYCRTQTRTQQRSLTAQESKARVATARLNTSTTNDDSRYQSCALNDK